jgi:hypothetical protein
MALSGLSPGGQVQVGRVLPVQSYSREQQGAGSHALPRQTDGLPCWLEMSTIALLLWPHLPEMGVLERKPAAMRPQAFPYGRPESRQMGTGKRLSILSTKGMYASVEERWVSEAQKFMYVVSC